MKINDFSTCHKTNNLDDFNVKFETKPIGYVWYINNERFGITKEKKKPKRQIVRWLQVPDASI